MVEGAGKGEDEAGSIKEGRVEVEGGGEVEEGVMGEEGGEGNS